MKRFLVAWSILALLSAFSCGKSQTPTGTSTLTVGIYSETHKTVAGNAVLNITGGTVAVSTNGQFSEGYEGLQFTIGGSGWFRFDFSPLSPVVLTNCATGYLNFCIKTSSPALLRVGVKTASGESWLPLTNYTADGKWHAVSVPVGSFSNIDLSQVTTYIMISNSNAVASGDVVYLDDVFWSDSPVQPEIWDLKWSDEFTNAAIDTGNWNFEIGNNGGWGNSELESYTGTNAHISNGYLAIDAYFTGGDPTGVNYSSSRLTTQNKKFWTYGRVMARMRLSVNAQGAWPAFWMLGTNNTSAGWPACGEIDIMECGLQGLFNSVGGTLHWWSESASKWIYQTQTVALSSGTFADAFHVFEIEWNSRSITWKLDGAQFHSMSIFSSDMTEFQKPQFIILNLAIGGPYTPYTGKKPVGYTNLPNSIFVDWVRVYQLQP